MPNTALKASRQLIGRSDGIPKGIWLAFKSVNFIHRIWRRLRFTSLYTNKNNFLKLGAGHLAEMTVGDNLLVRLAGQAMLIAVRILDCIKTQERLSRACLEFKMHWRGDYDSLDGSLWNIPSEINLLQRLKWKGKLYLIAQKEKIIRLSKAFFEVIKQLFILSMKTLDVVEAISFNPEIQREGVRHVFINGSKLIDQLSSNEERLKEKLLKNKALISRILSTVNAQHKTESFINTLSSNVEHAGSAIKKGKRVKRFGSMIVKKAKQSVQFFKNVFTDQEAASHPKYVKRDFIPDHFVSL